MKCYLHEVQDPNLDHYDTTKHHICVICAVKLWELAKAGLEFDMRDSIVQVRIAQESDL
jgi:hypothetical protein